MSLPSTLSHRLSQAAIALNQHPNYDLALGHRHAIYQALGMPGDSIQERTIGHQRRITLALLSVGRVLPSWRTPDPQGRDPHALVAATEALLHGQPVATDCPRHFFHPGNNDDPIGIAATWAFDVARFDRDCPEPPVDLNPYQVSLFSGGHSAAVERPTVRASTMHRVD